MRVGCNRLLDGQREVLQVTTAEPAPTRSPAPRRRPAGGRRCARRTSATRPTTTSAGGSAGSSTRVWPHRKMASPATSPCSRRCTSEAWRPIRSRPRAQAIADRRCWTTRCSGPKAPRAPCTRASRPRPPRPACGSVVAGVIGDRLRRNDPQGVVPLRQYADRLDPSTRRTLSTAAGTLSNTFDAAAWLRDRTATLRAPEPTGDAALDTVNAAGASMAVTLNGRNVGIDASTRSPTSTLTVMTDEFGNLVAIFPGRMP